jgi:hypothetical protein
MNWVAFYTALPALIGAIAAFIVALRSNAKSTVAVKAAIAAHHEAAFPSGAADIPKFVQGNVEPAMHSDMLDVEQPPSDHLG